MAHSAEQAVDAARRALAPAEGANRLVPVILDGKASREVLGCLAGEQQYIVAGDRRSFLHLAARSSADPAVSGCYEGLARAETEALARLEAFAAASGLDEVSMRAYEPMAACQGYPSYVAWLALNADPGAVVLALVANFSAWGGYCAAVARGLRRHYGFDDSACAFFDFFADPDPGAEEQALRAVDSWLASGGAMDEAMRYGRMLQAFELMFWNTLADRIA